MVFLCWRSIYIIEFVVYRWIFFFLLRFNIDHSEQIGCGFCRFRQSLCLFGVPLNSSGMLRILIVVPMILDLQEILLELALRYLILVILGSVSENDVLALYIDRGLRMLYRVNANVIQHFFQSFRVFLVKLDCV